MRDPLHVMEVAAGSKPNAPGVRPPAKHAALADITNTGRLNPTRPIDLAEVLKENAMLLHLLGEKTKIIEASSVEMQKLRLALQRSRQQNLQLAHAHSQMLAELNTGKDRLKALQHELACTTAVLKVKASELEGKNKISSKQRQNKVNSEETQSMCSKVAAVEDHQIDNKTTHDKQNLLIETQSSVPSTVDHPKAPQEGANNRGATKRKSESRQGRKDTIIEEGTNIRTHSLSTEPVPAEDHRKSSRRKSARLNPGSCEAVQGWQASVEIVHEEVLTPSAPCSSSVLIEKGNKDWNSSSSGAREFIPEEQAVGRRYSVGRPLRRAAEKIVSYKERPINVKLRQA